MTKMIVDGNVAVLVSYGYGAGWKSWNWGIDGIETHRDLVQMVLDGRQAEMTQEVVSEILGLDDDTYVCVLGNDQLEVEWVPVGTRYRITEYDGAESLEYDTDLKWDIA